VRDLKDPRVSPMTTIMAAEVTNDQKLAKVKVSVYDENEEVRTETVAALTQAAGFIRRELGARMKLRQLPQLKFTLDHSIEYSVRIAGILQELARERPEE